MGGDSATAEMPPKLAGRIELRQVNFGYSALEAPLLANLSLAISPGSRVERPVSRVAAVIIVAVWITSVFIVGWIVYRHFAFA